MRYAVPEDRKCQCRRLVYADMFQCSAADASCRVRCGSEGDDARGGDAGATMIDRVFVVCLRLILLLILCLCCVLLVAFALVDDL